MSSSGSNQNPIIEMSDTKKGGVKLAAKLDPPSDDEGASFQLNRGAVGSKKRQSVKQQKDALLKAKETEADDVTGEVHRREATVNAHGIGLLGGSCVAIDYSDCGKYLATAGEDNVINVYTPQSFQPMFEGGGLAVTSQVCSLDFSHDGKILAAGLKDGRVALWHLEYFGDEDKHGIEGTVKYSESENLKFHDGPVNAVCFSSDGKLLASGGDDTKIVLWDMDIDQGGSNDRKPIVLQATIDAAQKRREEEQKQHSGEGSKIDNRGRGMSNHEKDITKHEKAITCLSWSPEDRFLASGGEDNTVRIWNFSDKQNIEAMVLSGHSYDVLDVAFSPDGNYLASVGGNSYSSSGNEIRIWDMKDKDLGDEEEWALFTGHNLGVTSCAWGRDSKTIVTGSYDKTVRFWSMDYEKCTRVISTDGEIRDLSAGSCRQFIAVGDSHGQVSKYHFTIPVEGYEEKIAKAFQVGGLEMENLIKEMVYDEGQPLADGGIYLVTEYLLHNEKADSLTLFFNTIWSVLVEWDAEQTDTDKEVAKAAQKNFIKLETSTLNFFKHVKKFREDFLEVLSDNLDGDEIQKVAETDIMLLIMEMFGRGGVWEIYYSEIVIYTIYMLCFVSTTIAFKYANDDLTMEERAQMQFSEYILIITSFYFFLRELYQNYNEFVKDSSYRDQILWINKNKRLNAVLCALGLSAVYYLVKGSDFMNFVILLTTWACVFMFSVLGWWASTDILSPAGSIAMLVYFVRYGPGQEFNHLASGVALINWVKFLNVIRGLNKEIASFVLMIEFILADLSSFMIVQMLMMVMFGHAFYLELSEKKMGSQDDSSSNPFATKWDTIQTLIKTLFGDFDSSVYTYNYVKAIFFLYMFLIIIIMLNVLIAIVSDSYARAMEQSNQIYCRSRLQLIVEMKTIFGGALGCVPNVEGIEKFLGKERTPLFIQEKINRNKKGVEIELEIPPTSFWDDKIEEIVVKVKKMMEVREEEKKKKGNDEALKELKEFVSKQSLVNEELKKSNADLQEKVGLLVTMIGDMTKGRRTAG